ncbi:MAG: type IV secretion system protein [Rickettsiales bacterium]|jgi:hypothetical protein|nr:type IV secretion system protein [Rickettsiales bacterium]
MMIFGIVAFIIAMLPVTSHAYNFENRYGVYDVTNPANTLNNANFRVCAINNAVQDVAPTYQNRKQFGIIKRTVLCVKEAVLYATYKVLSPFSNFFARLIAIMCTLAVVAWGLQAMAGRRMVSTRDAFVLAIKIGLVIMFTSNFAASFFDPEGDDGGLFGLLLDSMEQFIGIVIGYADVSPSFSLSCYATQNAPSPNSPLYILTVWDKLDCMVETLIGGIFSPITLTTGIVGFLIAALISSAFGFFIGIMGFMLIAMVLVAIARSVYIFISAFIAFALMVLISPMVIPTILFPYTKPYFDKWLKVTLGLVLQPIFMFVYLAMLLAVFDVLVFDGPKSLYRSITGSAYNAHVSPSRYGTPEYRTIGQWLISPPPVAGRASYGVYQPALKSEYGANLNYNTVLDKCDETACEVEPTINKRDIGVLGTIGEEMRDRVTDYQVDLYTLLNRKNIFKTGIPVMNVNWDYLMISSNLNAPVGTWNNLIDSFTAYDFCRRDKKFVGTVNGTSVDCKINPDPLEYEEKYFWPYIIGIATSLVMGIVTMFIFMMMLRSLPYIGIGISGETLSIPKLGIDKLAMPGSNSFESFQNKLANSVFGRNR